MAFEITVKYSCTCPHLVIDSIKHDEMENDSCKIEYQDLGNRIFVRMQSEDLKALQKMFNSFSQRFKLATDTYNFCLDNQKSEKENFK